MSEVRDETIRILKQRFGLIDWDARLVVDLPNNWRVRKWADDARIAKEQAIRNLEKSKP